MSGARGEVAEKAAHVTAVAAEHAADVDRRARFPEETLEALRETGLLGLIVPAAEGGLGAGAAETVDVVTAVAEGCASSGMILTMHLAAVAVLRDAGGFRDVLAAAAQGRHLSTLALSERATRSSFWLSMGQAQERDGQTHLDVEKSFVTSAGPAHSYVVSTATPGRDDPHASDLYLVRAEQEGVEVLDWWRGSGLRGNASAPMRFRCRLPASARIGPPGEGQTILLQRAIPWFHLGAASVSVGLSRGAVRAISDHLDAARLEHLDERLIDQPVVRHTLGKLATALAAADGYVRSVAAGMDAGLATRRDILQLKAVANEVALVVTDGTMRLGGGAAYSGGSPLDRLFRDARAGVVMAPTPDMIYDMVGRDLAGLPYLPTHDGSG